MSDDEANAEQAEFEPGVETEDLLLGGDELPEPESRTRPDEPPAPQGPDPNPPERAQTRPAPAAPSAPGGRERKAAPTLGVSGAGVTLIKEFEGFPYGGRPYRDMVGVWTIGYGHTKGVGPNSKRLTEPQASALLRVDLDDEYAPPVRALSLPFSQHQFDALVSFVYNCGPGAISSSTGIGRALRARAWQAAADALLAWNKAGGVAVAGLTRRRTAERALFLAADDPLDGYTDAEKRWIREYDRLVRENTDRERRLVLRRVMTEQRQKIWRLAQPKPDGGDDRGWEYKHRRRRYASLLARSR